MNSNTIRRLLPLLLPWLVHTGALAQAPERIEIGIMIDQAPSEFPSLYEQLQAEILAVVGSQADVGMSRDDIRVTGFDLDRAEEMYQDLLAGDADLIIAFGPVSASVVWGREAYPKPTVLFGGVNQDVLGAVEPGATSGVPNFTYLLTAESYERDLRTLDLLYHYRRVGIVVPKGPLEALGIRHRLERLMPEIGSRFEIIAYDSPDDLDEALDRIDAVYLLQSLFIPDEEIREIADLLIAHRVASFSGARRDDVELGLLATNQPRDGLDVFFRRLALVVESVVNGEELGDLPVRFDMAGTLTVNFQTARAIGIPIKHSLITTTEFVGEYENPAAVRRYGLSDLVEEALDANLDLGAARHEVALAGQDRRSAWSSYLPSVSVNATQTVLDPDVAAAGGGRSPQYSTAGAVSLGQVLFSPDVNAAISVQGSLLDAQREELRASEWDVVLGAASAYFTALTLAANVEIKARNLDSTRQNLRLAEQSFEAGQAGRGDVLRLESEAARDMKSLVDAVIALDQSHHAINQLVNQPVDRQIDVLDATMRNGAFTDEGFEEIRRTLDDPSLREPFEEWLSLEAVANSPELRSFDHGVDAVNRNLRLHGLERFLPTVGAGLDVNRTLTQQGAGAPPMGASIDQYYTLGVSVSVPLFDSNRRRIARETSLIELDRLRLARRSAEIAIEGAVRDVVLDLRGDIAGMELSAISEAAAGESLRLSQAAYASGAITLVELLDAQTNSLNAQIARASATYSFLSTAVALQRLVGHFTVLGSPEQNDAYMQRFQTFLRTREAGQS